MRIDEQTQKALSRLANTPVHGWIEKNLTEVLDVMIWQKDAETFRVLQGKAQVLQKMLDAILEDTL